MRKLILIVLVTSVFISCNRNQDKADAYGNFEGNDVIISAESSGQLIEWQVNEGSVLKKNQIIGLIDTLSISLQIEQLHAKKIAVLSNQAKIQSQAAVSEEQLINLLIEQNRITKLLNDGAATKQQFDNIDGQINVVHKQIASIKTQIRIIEEEAKVLDKQMGLLLLQKEKCSIINPMKATVLNTFVKQNEMVMIGKPLYKIANLNEMHLRVYVGAKQLASVELGHEAEVLVDNTDGGLDSYTGKVSWISEQAEFTPKVIQTKEERVNLVYAVKLIVKNDGKLKIGMPAEVNF
ncbi:MAG: HlyD family efflux transporter periplasmic adaptor subunit [Bacteroidetes bacterium]|jgi:HlyD family secretion protein|nr:HlyD family efflux transporter periplasmic adaptor subunit [Bacteroidota bacterium]MBT5529679.1 HlyD family efflux transporter periplasmic adaptor subunit [Cytophagia bacterium]MBT3423180.1 HlyD family efflux transporter periplasmic adaptor subunit [Bacteroidota bacterium]MBT3802196.1 HlyD family efflux transporter periplasmic adaptor subunit [Bacteroidota bacterium]MBT3935364.1 HlyD family efflux transporter periplasmic adaptor subunit [Bacteroidota bacterium]